MNIEEIEIGQQVVCTEILHDAELITLPTNNYREEGYIGIVSLVHYRENLVIVKHREFNGEDRTETEFTVVFRPEELEPYTPPEFEKTPIQKAIKKTLDKLANDR